MNGVPLNRGDLRILSGSPGTGEEIVTSPRIGITKAAEWPLRFCLAGSKWLSRRV
jgi:DNA-3-methyladenine glycosylase